MKDVLFACCTPAAKEATLLYTSVRRLGLPAHFVEHNRTGLSACYNRVLNNAAGQDRIIASATGAMFARIISNDIRVQGVRRRLHVVSRR